MKTISYIWTLFRKDWMLEMRQQYSLYGVMLYVASTIFVLYLAIEDPNAATWNALFWITQLFVCINAVAKSFLQENKGRMLYFYSICHPAVFVVAKLLYNVVLMAILNLFNLIIFIALMGNPTVLVFQFIGISFLGGIGLSLVFTMLAAIASKAMQQASLMAILGFPIIIPQLLLLIRLSRMAFAEIFRPGAAMQIVLLLLALDFGIILLSVILFPFLWKD
ncbi:MAG: heme exporter protein CcmB [Chitinophagaceae bacterium]|nr:heme exporter protein CcmB [Chitinophagaceae bacterium]